MSKRFDVPEAKPGQAVRQQAPRRAAHPVYLILATFVAVVGTASLVAWWTTEFSVGNRARQGDAKAQYLLGKEYFKEAMSPRDYIRAALLIRKAAEQGYARAQTALGLLYENGLGVTRDYAQAARWLRLAADQGFPVAQNELGVMYAKGRGFARNLEQAAHWCRLAAAQGSEIARRNLQLAEVAQAKTIPELTAASKKIYKRVRLQKLEPDGVTFSFQPDQGGIGVAKLKFENLPEELQELCKCADKKGVAADSAYSQLGCISSPL